MGWSAGARSPLSMPRSRACSGRHRGLRRSLRLQGQRIGIHDFLSMCLGSARKPDESHCAMLLPATQSSVVIHQQPPAIIASARAAEALCQALLPSAQL